MWNSKLFACSKSELHYLHHMLPLRSCWTTEPPNLADATEFCQLAENQPKKIRPGRRWRFRTAAEKKISPVNLNAFLMISSAQNTIVLYSIDLTNNFKQPRALVTQIAFLHISSGLSCAVHYFYGRPIE